MKLDVFNEKVEPIVSDIVKLIIENENVLKAKITIDDDGAIFGHIFRGQLECFEDYLPDKAYIFDSLEIDEFHYMDKNIKEIQFNIGRYEYVAKISSGIVECYKNKLFYNGMYFCMTNEYEMNITERTFVYNLEKFRKKITTYLDRVNGKHTGLISA